MPSLPGWRSLGWKATVLRCDTTLINGQTFGWRQAKGLKLEQPSSSSSCSSSSSPSSSLPSSPSRDPLRVLPTAGVASPAKQAGDSKKKKKTGKPQPMEDKGEQILLNEWTGVVGKYVLSLRQEEHDTLYKELFPGSSPEKEVREQLLDYFSLREGVPLLSELYRQWGQKDPHFAALSTHLPGLRILRQDPVECLFSFLCSSNNHISRITSMLKALRVDFGTYLCDHGSTSFL